jgi:hypothetical protein
MVAQHRGDFNAALDWAANAGAKIEEELGNVRRHG